MIEVDGLWKAFGARPVLQGVSFRAPRGTRLALVGPNGSGKTTLLRCLLGLARYDGRITVDGRDPLRDHAEVQRGVAYVPQRAPALPVPVAELVAFWAAQRRAPKDRLREQCHALGLDLGAVWAQSFPSLSGGMQQKLLAAMALAGGTDTLLLDEPTANLDPAARAAFFAALSARDPAPTLVLSSHRLEELRQLVDRVIVLDEGRIAFDDPLDAFLADSTLAAAAGLDQRPGAPNLRRIP